MDRNAQRMENRRKAQANGRQNYLERSKDQLGQKLAKKFKTTTVKPIALLEEHFGELWGHNKPWDELTESEKDWRKKKDIVRNEIFNNGNNQSRSAMKELDRYEITYVPYHYDLPFRGE